MLRAQEWDSHRWGQSAGDCLSGLIRKAKWRCGFLKDLGAFLRTKQRAFLFQKILVVRLPRTFETWILPLKVGKGKLFSAPYCGSREGGTSLGCWEHRFPPVLLLKAFKPAALTSLCWDSSLHHGRTRVIYCPPHGKCSPSHRTLQPAERRKPVPGPQQVLACSKIRRRKHRESKPVHEKPKCHLNFAFGD